MKGETVESVNGRVVGLALASLVALDVVLATWGFIFPGAWFSLFHGAPRVDPQAYLPRAAGNWTAFAVLQAMALARWKKAPHWLAIVAGVRLSDVFTDISCAIFCHNLSPAGLVLLPLAGLGNLFFGLWFLFLHKRVTRSPHF